MPVTRRATHKDVGPFRAEIEARSRSRVCIYDGSRQWRARVPSVVAERAHEDDVQERE